MKYVELFEKSIPWLNDNPKMVLKYINDWDRRSELGDGDVTSDSKMNLLDIVDAQRSLKNVVQNTNLTIYRAMVLSPMEIERLEPSFGLGFCWTYDQKLAQVYNGKMQSSVYVFKAIVDEDQVDWLATIALYLANEKEIRLKADATIILLQISDKLGEVRPDLWNKTFKSSR